MTLAEFRKLKKRDFENAAVLDEIEKAIETRDSLLATCTKADRLLSNLMKAVPWGQTYDLDVRCLNECLFELPRVIAKATGK